MKYVVFESKEGQRTAICAFHPVAHSDIAEQHSTKLGKPVSAGFVHWSYQRAYVLGRSESLNLEPADGDEQLLTESNKFTVAIGLALKS